MRRVAEARKPELGLKHGTVLWSSGPAIPDSVVDNWEDDDLTEWSNTSAVATTSTSPVLEGSVSLQIQSPLSSAGDRPYSLLGDGLDYYPQKGDKFSVLLRGSTDADVPAFCWGVATNTNGLDGYELFHHPNYNDYGLRRLDDGSLTEVSRPSASLATDQTHEYEVQWHDGSGTQPDNTIEITVYETDETADLTSNLGRNSEVDSITVSDATYAANDGVGISNASGKVSGTNRIDRYWHLGSVE